MHEGESCSQAIIMWRSSCAMSMRRCGSTERPGTAGGTSSHGRRPGCPCRAASGWAGTRSSCWSPPIPPGGVARFLEKKGEGIHHLCVETSDVAARPGAYQGRQSAGDRSVAAEGPGGHHRVPAPRRLPWRAGRAGATGPRSASRIAARRVESGRRASPPSSWRRRTSGRPRRHFAKHFDAQVAGPDRDPSFGVMRMQVQIGRSRLTLLDGGELAALPAEEPFVGARRDGVFGVCLAVADFAAAERYLAEKRTGVSIRRAVSAASIAKVLSEETHGVGLYLCSQP